MAESNAPGPPRRRHKIPKPLIAVAVLVIAIAAWLFFRGGDREDQKRFTGYVVSDTIYMASPVAGTLAWVGVERGQGIAAGTPLFRIDPVARSSRAAEARAEVGASEAAVRQRQADLARARADLAAAETEVRRATTELARLQGAERDKAGSVSRLQIDQAQAAARSAAERRNAARTAIAAAGAAIQAGEAEAERGRAGVTQAEHEVRELAPAAPARGRIEDVLYQPGEWVAANAPVVAIVPRAKVKVRFYVPQGVVASYRPGTKVAIACDGCASGMRARVDFVAPRPEFTPPVIYSLETRDKLVFLVEAAPADPDKLVPGQPMDVTPLGAAR